MKFRVGDLVAHPMHGAGVIDSIVSKKVKGRENNYYVLKLSVDEMKVMIPVCSCEKVGVRPIICSDKANKIMNSICDIEVEMNQNWNKRYRENMTKIKSGDLMEVAEVVKGVMLRDYERGLSMGERKMLSSAKQILISELVLSSDSSYDEIVEKLENSFLS